MRRLVVPALLAVLSFSVPASAQFTPGQPAPRDPRLPGPLVISNPTSRPGIWRDVGDVRAQIENGRDAGTISRQQALQLRRESRMIGVLAERYGRDGLSEAEQSELEARTLYLRGAVNAARTR